MTIPIQAPRQSDTGTALPRMAYTVAEVAQMTGLPLRTVYDLTDTGELPCKRVGRRKFIRADDLERFMNAA